MMGGDICCQVASGIIKSASLFCFMATRRLLSGAIIGEERKKAAALRNGINGNKRSARESEKREKNVKRKRKYLCECSYG